MFSKECLTLCLVIFSQWIRWLVHKCHSVIFSFGSDTNLNNTTEKRSNRKNHKKSRFTLAKNVAFRTHKSTMAARCLISSITMSSCTLFRYLKMFFYFSKIVFIPNNTLLILSIRQSAVARSSPLSGVTCASIASLSTRHWRRRRRPLKRSSRKRLIESLT